MARPKKTAPRPDTVLVTFRLSRTLVGALDALAAQERAQGRASTRSEAARSLMQQALTALDRGTRLADGIPGRVLAAVGTLARGGRTVALVDLRARLGDLSREALDRALRSLERDGRVALGRAVDLAALTSQDRSSAIHDEIRGLLVYVSLSGTSAPV